MLRLYRMIRAGKKAAEEDVEYKAVIEKNRGNVMTTNKSMIQDLERIKSVSEVRKINFLDFMH